MLRFLAACLAILPVGLFSAATAWSGNSMPSHLVKRSPEFLIVRGIDVIAAGVFEAAVVRDVDVRTASASPGRAATKAKLR